jgi:hypothetical protein
MRQRLREWQKYKRETAGWPPALKTCLDSIAHFYQSSTFALEESPPSNLT